MELRFSDGLIPAIVQHKRNGKVLMLGYMNLEAYQQTLRSGYVTFFSRRRQKLWTKGETSGHRLVVREIRLDCDADAVLLRVNPAGPACHTGAESCFFNQVE